jgi:hypothetical protein
MNDGKKATSQRPASTTRPMQQQKRDEAAEKLREQQAALRHDQ